MIGGESLSQIYPTILSHILEAGVDVAPRRLPTIEVLGCQIRIDRPRARVLHTTGRVINPAFAVAETVWILSGSDDPWIYTYNSSLREYADDGVLRGAYGPRLRCWADRVDQLDRVRRLLLREPNSRQATVQLFDPSRDWAGARDVPCTVGHRFFVRGGALHMHTSMRSQDAWRGLPYDVFANTVLQELLAGWLNVGVGPYVHFVDSLHLYDRDVTAASRVVLAGDNRTRDADDVELAVPFETMDGVLAAVVAGDRSELSPGWSAYAATLASYRHWKSGQREDALAGIDAITGPLRDALKRWYAYLGADGVYV